MSSPSGPAGPSTLPHWSDCPPLSQTPSWCRGPLRSDGWEPKPESFTTFTWMSTVLIHCKLKYIHKIYLYNVTNNFCNLYIFFYLLVALWLALNSVFMWEFKCQFAHYCVIVWVPVCPQSYSMAVYLVKQQSSTVLLQRLRAKGIRNPDHSRALSKDRTDSTCFISLRINIDLNNHIRHQLDTNAPHFNTIHYRIQLFHYNFLHTFLTYKKTQCNTRQHNKVPL